MMPNFWQLVITTIVKIWHFHLTTVDLLPKTFLMLYPSLENSTTDIVITNTNFIHIFEDTL